MNASEKSNAGRSSSGRELERDEAFIERLRQVVAKAGGQNALARAAGISQGGLQRYLNGGEPTRRMLAAMAKAAGVSFLWLATGEGTMIPGAPVEPGPPGLPAPIDAADVVQVPVLELEAGAGVGAFAETEKTAGFLALSGNWVRRELHADPRRLLMISSIGDSMEPTIRPNDLLIVDQGMEQVRDDGIYVLRAPDGLLMVKRLQRSPDGGLRILSDNPGYADFEVPAAQVGDIKVVGRVKIHGRLI